MESLKKVINLNQAAKMSGYTQDYLGYLIRKGEIKGKKVGREWFTTEDQVKNYIFKRKIQHEEFAISDFFSRRRTNNIVLVTSIVFIGFFSVFFYVLNFSNKENLEESQANQTLSTEVEAVEFLKQ